jgi:hypothetical protein
MAEGIRKVSENVLISGRALTLTNGAILDNGVIPVGTLRCNPTTKGLEYKSASNTFSKFDASGLLISGSVTDLLLATDSVSTIKIKNLNVTTPKLAELSVVESKLANNAVTEIKLNNDAVSESKIKNNSISELKIKDSAITNLKIAYRTILSDRIADLQIITRTLADYAVTEIKIGTGAVTENKIKDDAVTFNKIKEGSVHSTLIPDLGIKTNHLNTQAVTTAKLAIGAVTSTILGDDSVITSKVANDTIIAAHLQTDSVTTVKIKNDAVTGVKIANDQISYAKLDTNLKSKVNTAVYYDASENISLKKDLTVAGKLTVTGDITGARILNAVYMDLAEAYIPGEDLEAGDIVEIREDGKVYRAATYSQSIVGVVSDEYAACYGATTEELESGEKIAVGLIGKVHVKVTGPIRLGQRVICIGDGVGLANGGNNYAVGKALETSDEQGAHKVLCLIYPN